MEYNGFFLYENTGRFNDLILNEVFPQLEKLGVRCFDLSNNEKQLFLDFVKLDWNNWNYVYTFNEREYPTLGLYFDEFVDDQVFLKKDCLDLYKMKSDFNLAFKKGEGSGQFMEAVKSRIKKSLSKRNS